MQVAETHGMRADGGLFRVAICALPTQSSRHNSPAHPHAITDFVRQKCGAGTGPLHFGATYVALNRNKRAITLNPNAAETARQVERLLGWADVVLIDAASEGAFKVSAATATAARPRLLYTKIEPGPGEYELQALTGPAGNQVTSVPGLADRFTVAAPLFPPRLLPSGLSAFAVLDVQFVPVTATLPLTRLDFPL